MLSQQGSSMAASFMMRHESRTSLVGGSEGPHNLLIEDASGTTKALLENVQTVYLNNLSANDQMQKAVRTQMAADEETARLREQNKKLQAQRAADEQLRASEAALTQELMQNKLLMQGLAKAQKEVVDIHDHTSSMLRELESSTNSNRGNLKELAASLSWAKEKQSDRRKLLEQKQQLWLEVRSLQGQLGTASARAKLEEQALRTELTSTSRQLEAAREEQLELRDRIHKLENKAESLSFELEREKQAREEAVSAMEKRLGILTVERDEAQRSMQALQQESAKAIAEAQSEAEARTKELKDAQQLENTAAKQVEQLKGAAQGYVEACEKLKAEVSAISEKLSSATQELEQLKREKSEREPIQ
ncbi:hypothetical protein AB1Y20_003145 [Prymnesium parvum]|uniref:Uncharacterized protein n=1 Tax=Prymnesium parvum TaxID=97485 RepID=A0AB34JBN4_PRYPA